MSAELWKVTVGGAAASPSTLSIPESRERLSLADIVVPVSDDLVVLNDNLHKVYPLTFFYLKIYDDFAYLSDLSIWNYKYLKKRVEFCNLWRPSESSY